jgi:hypothetical protein
MRIRRLPAAAAVGLASVLFVAFVAFVGVVHHFGRCFCGRRRDVAEIPNASAAHSRSAG